MSEDPNKSKSSKPPRIKLTKGNGNGNGNGDQHLEIPDPENLPLPGENAPPKVAIPKIPAKEATSPVDVPPTGVSRPKDETSQIVAGRPISPKSETTRIDLSSAKPAGTENYAALDQTMRVDLSDDTDAASQAETSRIDLSQARPAGTSFDPFDSNQTMRIDLSEGVPGVPSSQTSAIEAPSPSSPPFREDQSQTMRVDLTATGDYSAAAASGSQTAPVAGKKTSKVIPPGETSRVDPSMQTMRVDLSSEDLSDEPPTEITPADASMQTMRIEIPEGIPSAPKSETSRLSLSATQSLKQATSEVSAKEEGKSKSGTIRLGDEGELEQLIENQDSINQQTMRIELDDDDDSVSTAPIPPAAGLAAGAGSVDLGEMMAAKPATKGPRAGSPKTIRIRKTDTPPPTRVLKKSPVADQTIRVQGSEPASEQSKTGTTRIELPEGVPETSAEDKKTIRIRRPGGDRMAVRPSSMSVSRAGFPSAKKKPGTVTDAPGWGYTAVAVLTAVFVGVTIYVLAAQISSIPADGISLPWPGRVL